MITLFVFFFFFLFTYAFLLYHIQSTVQALPSAFLILISFYLYDSRITHLILEILPRIFHCITNRSTTFHLSFV